MNTVRSEGRINKKKRREGIREVRFFDYSLLFVIIFLLLFGLVMIYSTSAYVADVKIGDSGFYFKRQLMTTVLGLIAMVFMSFIDYHILRRFWGWTYLLSVGLSLAVLAVGREYNGSKRWLAVGPISFQPSEFAKFAMMIVAAAIVCMMPEKINKWTTLLKMYVITMPLYGLVAINNLSNGIIIIMVLTFILFVASKQYVPFLVLGGAGVFGIGAIFVLGVSYRASRIEAWLHPETSDKAYQTLQGLYAIGSGGFFGKGLGQSLQKLGPVPEAQNDMIFSIICEELGLFGAIALILLFGLLIYRLVIIAINARDLFGSLLVVGVLGQISSQVIFNIAVVTNTIPNTGISLPFVSYGGTSVIFLLAEMGVALNVSKSIKLQA